MPTEEEKALKTTNKILLDVQKASLQTIKAKQYDNDSRYVHVEVVDNGVPFDLTGYVVNIRMLTPDGRCIYDPCVVQDDGTVLIEFTDNMLYVGGKAQADLQIIDATPTEKHVLSTMTFYVSIQDAVYADDAIIASDEYSAVTELYRRVELLDETVTENERVRNENEDERKSNEEERQSNEDTRQSQEDIRQSNEATRQSNEDTRQSNEATRQSQESTRQTNEASRVSAEASRVQVEAARVEAENARVQAENARVQAENSRVQAEDSRVEAENERVANENARLSAESDRVDAENLRESNEATRQTNESTRQSNEATRQSNEDTRQANEDARKANEAARQTSEAGRVAAEEARVEAEDARVAAENARDTAETIRDENETARINAETARASAEDTREANEDARKTNEAARQNAESTRETNESTRQSNESTRQSNETTRESNEATRQQNESDRVDAEDARVTAETARASAESIRATNESERVTNETQRQEDEQNRIDAEDIRVSNENSRISAENTRVSNESARATAEEGRVSAENQRVTDTARALSDVADATTAANQAASDANTAAQNAIQATSDARDAISDMEDLMEDSNLVHTSQLGVATSGDMVGVATLDTNGFVPSTQLPSYVDDVLEGLPVRTSQTPTGTYTAEGFILMGETTECTPESGKIYIDMATNNQYRWSGSIYVTTGSSIVIGETAYTAFAGSRGKALEGRMDTAESDIDTSVKSVTYLGHTVTVEKNDGTINTFDTADAAYSDMVGATATADGVNGLAPKPHAGDQDKLLAGSGTWKDAVLSIKGSAESAYRTGNVEITKANIGLGNVDNTADADKPISTAQQTVLDGKVDKETGKGLSTNDYTNDEKTKLSKTNVFYGTSSTASGTGQKEVVLVDGTGFNLVSGTTVYVKFTNDNTASTVSIKVGSTSAYPVYYAGEAVSASLIKKDLVYQFVFNGSQYEISGSVSSGSADIFIGTKAEVEAAITDGTITEDMIVVITDDSGSSGGNVEHAETADKATGDQNGLNIASNYAIGPGIKFSVTSDGILQITYDDGT